MTNNIRLRTKSLKIACSEQDAPSIIIPLTNVAAYFLGVQTHQEMPRAEAFAASVLESKMRLAMLIATAVGKPVVARDLGTLSIGFAPLGGAFRLSCVETTQNAAGKDVLQGYSVTLCCQSGLTGFQKLVQISRSKDLTADVERAIDVARQMGL